MSSMAKSDPNSTPKLSLFSLPNKSPEPPGMLTPPLMPPASVPFLWEEAPGKPRTSNSKPKSATARRCLELPPRMFKETQVTNLPSPKYVLEGPYYMGRSSSYSSASSLSFSIERGSSGHTHTNCKKTESMKEREGTRVGFFGSWGKKNSKRNDDGVEGIVVISPSSNSSLSSSSTTSLFVEDDIKGGSGQKRKVKISRFKRRRSFLGLSSTNSHSWGSIYRTFKQAMPWKIREAKMEESSDLNSLTVGSA